jgi:hypothetical protein
LFCLLSRKGDEGLAPVSESEGKADYGIVFDLEEMIGIEDAVIDF